MKKNIQHFPSLFTTPTFYQQLRWSNTEEIQNVLQLCTQSERKDTKYYDIVLGSELMYFNTDVELMVQTVMELTQKKGLFIHGHVFREYYQKNQLINLLATHNWTTIEIPHKEFISKEEMKQHGDWYAVRALISGPKEEIEKLREEHPLWKEFKEEIQYDEEEAVVHDESELFSLFQ